MCNSTDSFGHTGKHGAYLIQENESILMIDSTAEKPFVLKMKKRSEQEILFGPTRMNG